MYFIALVISFFWGFPILHFIFGKKWMKVIGLFTSSCAAILTCVNLYGAISNGFDETAHISSTAFTLFITLVSFFLSLKTLKRRKPDLGVIDSDKH